MTTATVAYDNLVIRQAIHYWRTQASAITKFFNQQPDEYYLSEVAPGRNRGIYLLGHLVAANDGMFPLLGFGERLFPELEKQFLLEADKTTGQLPSIAELKEKWTKVNQQLEEHFAALSPAEWLGRHTKVSAEDFAAEPLRNKLNVLLSRTSHMSYHLGQLVFLNSK